MSITVCSHSVCFSGMIYSCKHKSSTLGGLTMKFSVFFPNIFHVITEEETLQRYPTSLYLYPQLYWLSGLTCTDENFVGKCNLAFKKAHEIGIAIIIPDTSPRGANIPGEDDEWDFGTGASYYVNAIKSPYDKHYQMYDYIVEELPSLVAKYFPVDPKKMSISGHSVGGHGSLMIGLKNPNIYKSISAFAPMCHPCGCPWGEKAFQKFLGEENRETLWKEYDAVELLKTYEGEKAPPILIDQGSRDQFLVGDDNNLQPFKLLEVSKKKGIPVDFNWRGMYDHGYFFINSFIEEHIEFHAKHLKMWM